MLTRIISALIGAPLIILILIVKGDYLYLFAGLLSLIGTYEYYKAVKTAGIKTLELAGYVFCLAFYILLYLFPQAEIFSKLLPVLLIVVFTYELFTRKAGVTGIVHTLFSFIYVSFLLAHLIFIYRLEGGELLIWLPFLTAWFSDSSAYFTGVTIGKRKLFPTISPHKTLEGYLGGIVGCSVLITVFGFIITKYGYDISLIHFVIIGLICGLASEIGDLAGSYIKRFTGIKDFGKLIPGHGGILDRFDSILFTLPVVYYYFLFVQNI